MNLDPRAIALQGIGYSPRLVAVQGFALEETQEQVFPAPYWLEGTTKRKRERVDTDDDLLLAFLL